MIADPPDVVERSPSRARSASREGVVQSDRQDLRPSGRGAPSPRAITRWLRLAPERRRLVARALATVIGVSAAVALLPFRRALGFGLVPLGTRDAVAVSDVVWAVEAAAARVPLRTMCIEKGLAVQRLLRRSGIPAQLHYGARIDPTDGALKAHVWVSVDAVTVIGGEVAADYAEIPMILDGSGVGAGRRAG